MTNNTNEKPPGSLIEDLIRTEARECLLDAAADDGGDSITINAAGDASRVAEIVLQNRVNIPPTIKVRQGSPIRIFVAKDLDFTGTPTAGPVYGGE